MQCQGGWDGQVPTWAPRSLSSFPVNCILDLSSGEVERGQSGHETGPCVVQVIDLCAFLTSLHPQVTWFLPLGT
jgi:hypothetical protein